MNICFVHGSNDLYGASNVLLHDAAALRSEGHHVAVQLPYSGPLDPALRSLGCEVDHTRVPVLRRSHPLDTFRTNPLRKLGILADADVVVLHTLAVVPAVLPFAGRRVRPRIVTSVHEILLGRAGGVLAHAARAVSDGFLTNSRATKQWFLQASRVSSPIEMAYPVAPAYRGASSTPGWQLSSPGPVRLILAGRVSGRKGHLELARACDCLRAEGYEISLTLAGAPFRSDAQARSLDDLLAYTADRDWIDYVGELAHDELLARMTDHDLHVLATTDVEPFGLVIVEAWACGVPSLAPAVGGAAEAIALVEGIPYWPEWTDRVGALASALRFLFAQPSLMARPRRDAPVQRFCTGSPRTEAWVRLLGRAP